MRGLTARDIMNRQVLTVRDDRTVDELAAFFIEEGISGAPVVDAGGKLVGVVSTWDIVRDRNEVGTPSAPAPRGWRERANPEELGQLHVVEEGRLVRDIMTPTVFTIPESIAVAEIARTMIAGRIHRLFVIRAGKMVGVVTTLELLRLLAVEGEEAAAEVAGAPGRSSSK